MSASADPAVAAALRAAFGRDDADAIEPLTGGRSGATLLKLTVRGRHYVLRRVTAASTLGDPARELGCMSIAAELGVAPPVHFVDAATGVCIMDFIESTWLGPNLASGRVTLEALASLLRRLHDGPAFPRVISVADAVEASLAALAEQGETPPLAGEFLERVADIRQALAPHVADASCHFDLNPSNILFDGTRLWLVDWGLASLGDPYQDLAGLGVFSPHLAVRREGLLAAYLGRAPDARERAHLELSRALALVLYAVVFRRLAILRGVVPSAISAGAPEDLAAALTRIERQGTSFLDEPSFVAVMEQEARRACSGEAYASAVAALG